MAMIQVDDTLKQAADSFFMSLDTDTDTAVRLFLREAVEHHEIPAFLPHSIPKDDLLQAIEDARNGVNLMGPYDTVEEAMSAMLED